MPVFEIEANGKVYEVEAPDQAAAIGALGNMGGPVSEQPSVAADVAKSAGIGAVEGAIGLVGLPRALGDAGGWIADKLTDLAFGDEAEGAPDFQSAIQPPSADTIKSGVESVTGEFYKPQTTAGEFARTGAEFMTGGAAAMPRNAVRGALQFGLVPGMASEAAGQATEGTAAEPYARIAAALGGGLAAGGIPNAINRTRQNNAMIRSAPSRDDLRATSRAAYQAAENSGVVTAPQAIDNIGQRIVQRVTNEGFHPKIHPKVGGALESIFEDVAGANGLPIDRLELLRRRIGAAANSIEPDERRLATIAREAFDDEIANLTPQDLFAGSQGDLRTATEALKTARDNWRRQSKSELVQEAVTKADDRAATTGTGGNIDNAIRQNLRRLLDNPKTRRLFTADEQEAIRRAARASNMANIMRAIGRFSPTTGGLSAMLGLGGAATMPQVAIPAMAVGMAGKKAGEVLTRRNANIVDALVRSGGRRSAPVGVDPRQRVAQALAATQPLRSPEDHGIRVTIAKAPR